MLVYLPLLYLNHLMLIFYRLDEDFRCDQSDRFLLILDELVKSFCVKVDVDSFVVKIGVKKCNSGLKIRPRDADAPPHGKIIHFVIPQGRASTQVISREEEISDFLNNDSSREGGNCVQPMVTYEKGKL